MMSTVPSVADELRARRRAANLSQRELARLAGAAPSTVEIFESGYLPRTGRSRALERLRLALDLVEGRTD